MHPVIDHVLLSSFQDEWSDMKSSDDTSNSGAPEHYRGGGRGSRGRGLHNKPRGAPMPLSSVVVPAPLLGIEPFASSDLEGSNRKHGGSGAGRFDQPLPPRFQKRFDERGRGNRRGGSLVGGRTRKGGKESSPDNPDKEWETDSENSTETEEKVKKEGGASSAVTKSGKLLF